MMAFIDSVFHVIGSFISMVFEAIVAAVQFGFSVLGGLLGLVVNLGMLLLIAGWMPPVPCMATAAGKNWSPLARCCWRKVVKN